MSLEAGQIIDERYRLLKRLGAGGFGEVWLADEIALRRQVAIKFLAKVLDREATIRLQREVAALGRLAHDHIVTLFTTGEFDDRPYIVTELVQGVTLNDWINGPVPLDDVRSVGAQIASALVSAHRAGVIHRDLKPANIMVVRLPDGTPSATVLDFGIARLAEPDQVDITKTGEVIGTPGYMSPEQLRGRRDIGPATDLYNLGVILWQLIEGRPMFTARTALDVCMLHLVEPAPPLTRPVPEDMGRLLVQLLDKDPVRRGSAGAVLRVLSPTAEPRDVAEEPRSRRVRWLAIALGALAVLAAATLLLSREDGSGRTDSVASMASRALVQPAGERPPPDITPQDLTTSRARASGSPGCGYAWAPGTVRVDDTRVHARRFTPPPSEVAHSLIRVPLTYEPDHPTPLIVALHDGTQTPRGMLQEAQQLLEVADRERVLLLFVEGDRLNDARTVFGIARQQSEDPSTMSSFPWANEDPPHVVHVEPLLDVIRDAFCVDLERIFLLGQRRGSRGAEALLARSQTFAAAAMLDHSRKETETFLLEDHDAIPTLWITSRDSPKRPLDGKKGECLKEYAIVPLSARLDEMRKHHHCGRDPDHVPMEGAACETWDCDVQFVSCLVDGGGRWPDHPPGGTCEGPASTFDYAGAIWKFFEGVSGRIAEQAPPIDREHWSAGCFAAPGEISGLEKGHVVHRPRGLDERTPVPLVTLLHGASESPEFYVFPDAPLVREIDRRGWLLFVPGTPRVLSASDGVMRTALPWTDERRAMLPLDGLERVLDKYCVDTSRLFIIGVGRGGLAAERWQSRHPRFAAMATTAHRRSARTEHYETAEHESPIPYLYVWPTGVVGVDRLIPGCTPAPRVELQEQETSVRVAYGCKGEARDVPIARADCETWSCDVPYVSCRISGSHHWPPQQKHGPCEGDLSDFDYATEILSFFDRVIEEP